MFIHGGLLPPRRLGLAQPRYAEVPRIVFAQPLGIGQGLGVTQQQGYSLAAYLEDLPGVRPIGMEPQRTMLRLQR